MIIYDIASKKILPYLRGLLIHELNRRNLSQHKISKLLNISQPLVHKYLSKPFNSYKEGLVRIGIPEEEVLYVVNILAGYLEKGDVARFLIASNYYVNDFATRYACRAIDWIREYCTRGGIVDPHIEEYKGFINRLILKPNLYRLIPEVGMNIAYAPSGARDPGEIIALNGRIIRLDSRAAYAGEPMYGASRFLARILATAYKYDSSKRVIVNLSYHTWVIEALTRIGLKVVETGPHERPEKFWLSIEEALKNKPDAVGDAGGRGLEPNIFLLARSLFELEEILESVMKYTVQY
ncbi:thiamine-phosphate synthase family protein [Thermogladius sp. 4427co]|uniref:thiamine-phosphate synthase family protein n=1 Tax=Thermogladius sp. 4427co TaxID=3450718 RepID=UPI003F7B2649